jgi:hypothetical protein
MNVKTTTVSDSYDVQHDDYYLGVSCDKAITINLPSESDDGRIIIIKIEMKPPVGNRIITVKAGDGTIDGYQTRTIQVSNECVRLIYHDKAWRVI